MRARKAEVALTGHEFTPEAVDNAAGIAAAECSPLDDHRASAEYRREMVRVLFRRAVQAAAPFPRLPQTYAHDSLGVTLILR